MRVQQGGGMGNPFVNAQKQLSKVGRFLDISQDLLEVLRLPQRVVEVIFRWRWTTARPGFLRAFGLNTIMPWDPIKGGLGFIKA